MNTKLLMAVGLLLAASGCLADDGLQTAKFENYLAAGVTASQSFTCLGSSKADARIEYMSEVLSPTDRKARVTSMTVRGVKADEAFLSSINSEVGDSNVTGALVGCSSQGIRVTIHTFGRSADPATGARTLANRDIHVYLHEGSDALTRE